MINTGFAVNSNLAVATRVKAEAAAPAAPQAPSAPVPSESVSISTPQAGSAPATEPTPANGSSEPAAPKKWTVLLWSNSDNNLYRFLQADIDEAEKIGSTENMNVVVQTDHRPKGGEAVRMLLKTNNTPGVNSPVLEKLGQNNMGDPKELSKFIQWGMEKFPAEHYMVIISDHGASWPGACHDEGSNGWMSTPQIQQGLMDAQQATGKKVDVLGFDACLMANTEVMHQLKGTADFIVASEETEGGAGWQYNRVLSKPMLEGAETAMRMAREKRLDFTPREMAENVVTMAAGNNNDLPTMAAIDTSKVDALTEAMKGFKEAIVDSPVSGKDLGAIKYQTQGFAECKDLYDFADKVGKAHGSKDEKLAQAAEAVKSAVEGALVAESHSTKYPGAHGLTIELDKKRGTSFNGEGVPNLSKEDASRLSMGQYADLSFEKEVNWSAAQAKLASAT